MIGARWPRAPDRRFRDAGILTEHALAVKSVRLVAAGADSQEHFRDARAQQCAITVVLYDIGALSALFLERKLCALATIEFLARPTLSLKRTSDAQFVGSVDEQHGVAFAVERDFEQEWRVDDEARCSVACGGELPASQRFDAWMHDRFDGAARCCIAEEKVREFASQNRTICRENCWPEQRADPCAHFRLVKHASREFITHAHDAAKFTKHARNFALAAADAASDANDGTMRRHACSVVRARPAFNRTALPWPDAREIDSRASTRARCLPCVRSIRAEQVAGFRRWH